MTELALHVLDIANNSTRAGAKTVTITVVASTKDDTLKVTVADDGSGMDAELLSRVTDPFATTRTTRRVGLGVPLFKQAAEVTGGSFRIESTVGKGTVTEATFVLSSIDRVPMGSLASTVTVLMSGSPDTDFVLHYEVDGRSYDFTTADVRKAMDGLPLDLPEVTAFVEEMLSENIENINGGIII